MKVGISTHIFALRELNRPLLKDIADAGFKFVELWCSREHLGYHKPGRVKEVLGSLRDNGLELSSLHAPFYFSVQEARARRFLTLSSPDPSVREAALQEIQLLIDGLQAVGSVPMVLHTGLTASEDDPRLEETLLEGVSKLLPLCRRAGLLIALENGPGPKAGCAKIMELARAFDEKDVGICLDTGHSNIVGSLLNDLSLSAPRLLSIHVHDNDGREDQHRPPFSGSIPWGEFMSTLRKMEYRGPFIMETAGDLQPHLSLQETVRSMAKLGFRWPGPTRLSTPMGEM